MIKKIRENDLPACLKVFQEGYETVAIEFGLTEENSPDRGRASLSMDKLVAAFESGTMMFGYFIADKIVGFLGMKQVNPEICALEDIIVFPEYRENGYGTELLNFCKRKAKELGVSKVRLGMIDDNKRLKAWYEANGFITVSYENYVGAPYTVGRMECIL